MKCLHCGIEMINTVGGCYHCPTCGFGVNDLVFRSSNCEIPMPQGFGEQNGWICPVCGRGLAPWVDYCPCQSNFKITYETSTDGTYDVESYLEQARQYVERAKADLLEG